MHPKDLGNQLYVSHLFVCMLGSKNYIGLKAGIIHNAYGNHFKTNWGLHCLI